MIVKLIRFTPEPDELGGEAAALCTGWTGDPLKALRGALSRGHGSVSEHASFSFRVEGVSRALLAQLTRHRIASFSVQSQRYVSQADCFDYVIPPRIKALGPYAINEYKYQMTRMHEWYKEWQEKLLAAHYKPEAANEDARFVLPNAATTALIMTMNARELMHFFELRTCNRAQWEIREMADLMLEECLVVAPEMFKNAGCACMQGRPCPEGKASCGKPRERVHA